MCAKSFGFPTIGMEVEEKGVLLAIDSFLLPFRKNLCLYLSKPAIRSEPVLTPSRDKRDAPDYLGVHFYGTVLLDGDKYRMWYYPTGLGETSEELTQGPLCYAESGDGIHWTKPVLGQVLFRGSRENNALALPEMDMETILLIKDEEDPDPERRYKLIYNPAHDLYDWTIRTATSPDGIHWTAGPELPVADFVEPSGFYKYNDMYFVNAQTGMHNMLGEGGRGVGRQGWVRISPDFDHWLQEPAESFVLPEPQDVGDLGDDLVPYNGLRYDQVHLGTAAVSYGNALVGLYGLWHNHEEFGGISGDLGLLVSNDGIHFREPVKGHVYISRHDSPAPPVEGKSYPTILCQANGMLNVGDETRIYHGRWRNADYGEDYYCEVALATLPRDRWGALGLFPEQTEGTAWSAPVLLPEGGCQVILNADGAEAMWVEVSDERFVLLPEFSGEQSGRTTAEGGIECPVVWPRGNLQALGGQKCASGSTLGERHPEIQSCTRST